MSRYDDGFLADLARLLRHGQGPLSQLVLDLNNPETRGKILAALETLLKVAPKKDATPKAARREQSTSIIDLETHPDVDPERYDILNRLSQRLLDRDKRTLVRLAEDLQTRIAMKDSKTRIVQKIVRGVRDLPLDQLERIEKDVHLLNRGSSESFRQLARFITRGQA